MIHSLPVLVLLLCSIGEVLAQERAEFRNGIATAVTKDANGRVVSARVRIAKPGADFPFTQGYRWGTEVRPPDAVVTAVHIRVGDREIFVPLSAYADLADPSSISIHVAPKSASLSIRGGDASTSYDATLTFAGSFVTRRVVRNRAFPESAWEETRYSYTVRTN